MGVTDLTLVAQIRRGLVPCADSRSYETRLRVLLRTLAALRSSAREVEPTPLISDVVDRIRSIHSFRLAITGTLTRQLVLSVAFDNAWEPYMRRIWRDLGPLLDIMFCNCEGYLLSSKHSFADYSSWVRSAQVDTELFYNASSLSVDDLHYLRRAEQGRRLQLASLVGHAGHSPSADAAVDKALHQALPAICALYRLADYYPPSTADGDVLRRATHSILSEASAAVAAEKDLTFKQLTPVEHAALQWFRHRPQRAEPPSKIADVAEEELQGGILRPYASATHGCLVLLEIAEEKRAEELISYLLPRVTIALHQDRDIARGALNVGFTAQGLRRLGLGTTTLDQLPPEFLQGMAERASVLGDYRYNHPFNWSLPSENWPPGRNGPPIQLSRVHLVVLLSCSSHNADDVASDVSVDPDHPLRNLLVKLAADLENLGTRVLCVESMHALRRSDEGHPREHFGFLDGLSQPSLTDKQNDGRHYANQAALGDILLGYENSLEDPPLAGRLWKNGSFLVIRKLRQDVAALETAISRTGLDTEFVLSKLMGRSRDGKNLIDGTMGDDFSFDSDLFGNICPIWSHIRRANPRRMPGPGLPPAPRLVRRSMTYGPQFGANASADRGLMFMAFNASIAEQFEVIQSWLSGGNSSGQLSYSGERDPFLGINQDDEVRAYELRDGDTKHVITLDGERPFVVLQWGCYLFVPSVTALADLRMVAHDAARSLEDDSMQERRREIENAVKAKKGAALIARLQAAENEVGLEAAAEQWKIVLEDLGARLSGASDCVWTAIRELHQGALRTPYGVLVCSKKMVLEVFANAARRYTVSGYAHRMQRSFGLIYLGMDDGPVYRVQADPINRVISSISESEAFSCAYSAMQETLCKFSAHGEWRQVEVKDLVDGLLAEVSRRFFDVPDDLAVVAGGWHWGYEGTPTCPGYFHSPSRFLFQPNPGPEAKELGECHGAALLRSVTEFVRSARGRELSGPISSAILDMFAEDDVLAARTLIGVMMGFLPTVDGTLRSLLFDWISDRSLWDYQATYRCEPILDPYYRAKSALCVPVRRTMQLRPVPELVWRTALEPHALGRVAIQAGDKLVVSIVSAMHELRADDADDLSPVFGGSRDVVPVPQHACPGYEMAMGVIFGSLAALMEHADYRPTLSPLAVKLTTSQELRQ